MEFPPVFPPASRGLSLHWVLPMAPAWLNPGSQGQARDSFHAGSCFYAKDMAQGAECMTVNLTPCLQVTLKRQ